MNCYTNTTTATGVITVGDNMALSAQKSLSTDTLKCVSGQGTTSSILISDNMLFSSTKALSTDTVTCATNSGTTGILNASDNITMGGGKTLRVDNITASASTTGIKINTDIACSGMRSTDRFGSNIDTKVYIVNDVLITTAGANNNLNAYGNITASIINATSALQINSVAVSQAPWDCGRVASSGTITTRANGQQTAWTISHTTGSGLYTISWTANHPLGSAYGVLCSTTTGNRATYTSVSAGSITIQTYNQANTLTDIDFTFQTVP